MALPADSPKAAVTDDPRVTGDYVHALTDGVNDVVLIGVVHDHPASKYRVRTVLEEREPGALALELPPLAVPLFERYADDDRTPPAFGGEMSAAVQAATTDRVVGIDGPTPGFLARLGRNLCRDDPSLATVRRALGSLASVTRHAVVCRFAATCAARAGVRLEVDAPVAHDCDRRDEPARQAEHERREVRKARSVKNTFEPAAAVRVREETREEYMSQELDALREEGEVVAVVGIDHLEALADRVPTAADGR